MAFQKFIPPPKQKSPRVAIRPTGIISFNVSAAAAYGLAEATHVSLHFDQANKLVGVTPSGAKEPGAFKLTHLTRVASVRARVFFETLGLALTATRAYPAEVRKDGMIVISLGDVRRKRGPNKQSRAAKKS